MAEKKKSTKKTTRVAKPTVKKDDLVVFAFRLTQAERDKIHATAGPRNATRLVRQVAVAFAHEDEKAFREAVKEAKEARA